MNKSLGIIKTLGSLILAFSVIFACSDQGFQSQTSMQQLGTTDDPMTLETDEVREIKGDTYDGASEPIMVGGAFLACFVDHSAVAAQDKLANTQTVGCSSFLDAELGERDPNPEIEIVTAFDRLSSTAVVFQRQEAHPVWTWIAQIPEAILLNNIEMTIQIAEEVFESVRLKVSDSLPPYVLGLDPGAELKIRLVDTDLCLGGDPFWRVQGMDMFGNFLQLVPCAEALAFRFTAWRDGFRVHTDYPSTFECVSSAHDREHCNRTCIDLKNYGLDEEFELFICTVSEEAQLLRFRQVESMAVEIAANDRYIKLDQNDLQVRAAEPGEALARFHLISVPAALD